MWAGHSDGFLQVNSMWAGHPDGFLQVNPMWAGHPDGLLQVYPGWAGHPDGFLQVNTLLLYPSLSPYRWTDRWRNEFILVVLATLTGSSRVILVGLGNLRFLQVHSLRVGWRNFFYSCAVVSVFF